MTPELEKALAHVQQQFNSIKERFAQDIDRVHHNAMLIAIHGPEAYIRVIMKEEDR